MNTFFLNKEKKVMLAMAASVISLLISYAFLVFSSVSTVYALDDGKEILANITSSNSVLESEFSVKKEKASKAFGGRLVKTTEISYLDSSFENLVINR